MQKITCAECGKEVERKTRGDRHYKKTFCGRQCHGLYSRKYGSKKEQLRAKTMRRYWKDKKDPIKLQHKLELQRKNYKKRMENPEYRAKINAQYNISRRKRRALKDLSTP